MVGIMLVSIFCKLFVIAGAMLLCRAHWRSLGRVRRAWDASRDRGTAPFAQGFEGLSDTKFVP